MMNQRFILELSPAEFRNEREQRVKAKKNKAFKDWMRRFKVDETQDDIIFGEDEDIHEGIKLETIDDSFFKSQQTANRTYGTNPNKKDKGPKVISR